MFCIVSLINVLQERAIASKRLHFTTVGGLYLAILDVATVQGRAAGAVETMQSKALLLLLLVMGARKGKLTPGVFRNGLGKWKYTGE